ncbi:GNAT family N-acetyltransferase [Acaryochloris marina]|uniref:Acetyltransferase, putative n=1 Tax=Acaryochloris marina (strain MBIC 11017) TaxID=329726 RepID=B0CFD4_ACAM1|nr:GNAT family N-acetyltransferase [Acaryochloris marina]ABW25821.1 acetyltransferase, putative [Acaryochloris marina MBIC11017]BDM80686.1 N-acetyltransferase [Acaryochloris marina MBIC10699]
MSDSEPVQIRASTSADYAAIASIYNEAIATGSITFDTRQFEASDIQAWVNKFCDRECLLVIERQQQVLGWGIVKQYSDRPGYRICCETSIYLTFAEKGQGLGKMMQTALLQKVVGLGYHHVVVKIVATNDDSIAFHKSFGFEMVGVQREVGHVADRWQDVAIMQLILPQVPPYPS